MKDYVEEVEEFKLKYIYFYIVNVEYKEGVVVVWLYFLNYCNYFDLCFVDDDVGFIIENKSIEVEILVEVFV